MTSKEPLQNSGWPQADTGNASNPSPDAEGQVAPSGDQLLDKKAETYLREAANIEDLPDAQDEEEMDRTIENADA